MYSAMLQGLMVNLGCEEFEGLVEELVLFGIFGNNLHSENYSDNYKEL